MGSGRFLTANARLQPDFGKRPIALVAIAVNHGNTPGARHRGGPWNILISADAAVGNCEGFSGGSVRGISWSECQRDRTRGGRRECGTAGRTRNLEGLHKPTDSKQLERPVSKHRKNRFEMKLPNADEVWIIRACDARDFQLVANYPITNLAYVKVKS